jgi:putative oxidoreductase
MNQVSKRCAPHFYALLRIVAGCMFAMHGSLKLFGLPGDGDALPCWSLPGIGGIIELAAGSLIALGLFARGAAFLASGEMAVAYFLAHFPNSVLPIVNGGELAVLYCFLFLFIVGRGAGAWSLDALLRSLRRSKLRVAAGRQQDDASPAAVSPGVIDCWTETDSVLLPSPLDDAPSAS